MDKKTLLQSFNEEDRLEVLNLYEKYELSYEKDIPLFGNNFYPPNIWKFFEKFTSTNDFKVTSSGFFEDAERRMISFNNIYDIPMPYRIVKIINKSKFNNLCHKDYLGAIMALGLEREKLGDLRVIDDYAVLPIYEEITDYIIGQLKNVGKAPITVEEIYEENLPKCNYIEEVIIVSSLRMDNIVAKLARLSRGKAIELIDSGKVLIDYSKNSQKSKEIKTNQRITIGGTGKFIIGEIVGNTRSGKFKIKINKFV